MLHGFSLAINLTHLLDNWVLFFTQKWHEKKTKMSSSLWNLSYKTKKCFLLIKSLHLLYWQVDYDRLSFMFAYGNCLIHNKSAKTLLASVTNIWYWARLKDLILWVILLYALSLMHLQGEVIGLSFSSCLSILLVSNIFYKVITIFSCHY